MRPWTLLFSIAVVGWHQEQCTAMPCLFKLCSVNCVNFDEGYTKIRLLICLNWCGADMLESPANSRDITRKGSVEPRCRVHIVMGGKLNTNPLLHSLHTPPLYLLRSTDTFWTHTVCRYARLCSAIHRCMAMCIRPVLCVWWLHSPTIRNYPSGARTRLRVALLHRVLAARTKSHRPPSFCMVAK